MTPRHDLDDDTPTPIPDSLLRAATRRPADSAVAPRRLAKRIKVLLIDDNADDAELIELMLHHGLDSAFDLVSADTLARGREILSAGDCDVVLLDFSLRESRGLDTLIELDPRELTTPVVVLTGLDDPEVALAAVQHGAQDYLVKGEITRDLLVRSMRYAVERKAAERRLKAEVAVTGVLADAMTMSEAIPRCLQAICESMGWEVGAMWEVDGPAKVLHCLDVWQRPGLDVAEFEAMTRSFRFLPGIGLPGRVWSSGEPAWIPDVTVDKNFPRAAMAAKNELHGAFGFPILYHGLVTGVLEFFSRRVRRPDRDQLALLANLGSQIGQFIERKRAEGSLRIARQRLQAILDNSPAVIYMKDADCRYVLVNRHFEERFGVTNEYIAGKSDAEIFPKEIAAAFAAADRQVLESNAPREFDEVFRHADGPHDYMAMKFPLHMASGVPYAVCSIATDITDRKRAEHTKGELLRTQEELRIARDIQQRLFPKNPPALPGFDIAAISQPAEETGGDYFDYIPLPDGTVAIVIGDVSGHGYGPALLMAGIRAQLHTLALAHTDVTETLNLANRLIIDDAGGEHFVTLFFGRLHPHSRRFEYASAGHPTGYVLDAAGTVRARLCSTSVPLGLQPEMTCPTAPAITLESGDVVLLLTDGLHDAASPDGTRFGTDRALEVVQTHLGNSAREIVDALFSAVRDHCKDASAMDDVTAIVIKVA
jgi:PAS domain S-box-containing protein